MKYARLMSCLFLVTAAPMGGCGPQGLEDAEVPDVEVSENDVLGELEQGACTTGGYTAYPSGVSTFTTTTSASPWSELFNYANGELIECSSDRSRRSYLDATSGCFHGKHVNGSDGTLYKRGWTTTYNFRSVAFKNTSSGRARYTNTQTEARFHVKALQSTTGDIRGVNLFARYTDADNLYVAGFRSNGTIFISSKVKCNYRTIASGTRSFSLNTWYTLKLTVNRQSDGRDLLVYSINGTEVLRGYSGTNNGTVEADHLRSGTVGIRTDYVDVFLDEWRAF
jgi:hypothetical protein